MHSELILGLDIGSSSIRGALFDIRGGIVPNTLHRCERNFTTSDHSGAEIEAEAAFERVVSVMDGVLERSTDVKGEIKGVASCTFWHSLLGIDGKGEPTTPVYGWADNRSGKYVDELRNRFRETSVHDRTGARFHSSFWPAKLLWLKNEFPDFWDCTDRWIAFADFVKMRLCVPQNSERDLRVFTSVSMASATGLYNIRKDGWDEELMKFLEITRAKLPVTETFPLRFKKQFVKSRPRLSDATFHPSIGDGAAGNIGSGCVNKRSAALNLGTSGALRMMYKGPPPKKIPSGLWCYLLDNKRSIVGGALSDGGGVYAYLKKTLNVELADEEIGEEIARRGADAHGLTVMPFFFGERSTGYNENARGHILGLNPSHDAIDILQAAMESVAFRFAEILGELLEVSKIEEIVVSGGAIAASPVWTQIIADVLGRELIVSDEPEASLRGAVLLALESLGKIDSIDSFPYEKNRLAFHPKCHEIYKTARKRHISAYQKLFKDQK
jgi:gluconokinase